MSVFEVPPKFASDILKKLDSIKTEEEKRAELIEREESASKILEDLKIKERKRRDDAIHDWFCGFFRSELIKKVLNKIETLIVYSASSGTKNEFARDIIEVRGSTGEILYIREFDLGTMKNVLLVGKFFETQKSEVLSEELRDGFYKNIQSGKVWETIHKNLKDIGFY